MFNTGFRGKRASDGTGIINPQEQFVQNKYPVPIITSWSISGSDDTALDPAGGQTVLVNGGGFAAGCAVTVNGVTITPVTVISPNQISFTSTALAGGSYTLIVYNSEGGGAILVPGLVYSSVPTYTTGAGSIGSGYETTAISTSVVATSDSSLTYTITSGALPSGASMTSGGVITGTYPVLSSGSSETFYFDITATDAESQDVTRSFSLTTNIDVVTWVTPSSGATINLDGTAYSQALSATDAAGYSVSYTANALPTGLTLSSGTISGTPTVDGTSSTLLTATAATTNRTGTNTITWVVSLNDMYFKYNTMLLSADSSIQTSSFVSDNSINNQQLTVVGDTRATNFNPYQQGFYSVQYDGTVNGVVSIPHNSKLSIMSGDTNTYIAECFVYWNVVNGGMSIMDKSGRNTISFDNWSIRLDSSKQFQLVWAVSGTPGTSSIGILNTTTVPVPGKWYHVALVKSNTNWSMFVDGVRITTYNGLNTANDGNPGPFRIGLGIAGEGAGAYMNGYISNVRVYNGPAGSAPYSATSTTLTVPTSPALPGTYIYAISNQSARYDDNSFIKANVTGGTGAKISTAHPFSTVYQAGTQYYSTKFDGTGDYLTLADNSAWVVDTDYTIEFWIYCASFPGQYNNILSQRGGASSYWGINYDTSLGWSIFWNNGSGETKISRNQNSPLSTWVHVAIVKSGTTGYMFLNGTQAGATFSFPSISDVSSLLYVGAWYTPGDFINGNLSNLRIVKGSALYTSNFTPSTTPLTAVSGTVLLTCQDSTLKDNSTNNFAITSYGDVKPVAVSPFTPSSYTNTEITTYGSGYFDGTGDYILVQQTPSLAMSGDYTVEAWVYLNSVTGVQGVYSSIDNSVDAWQGPYLGFSSTSFLATSYIGTTDTITHQTTVTIGQWYHIAICRSGSITKSYLNGVQSTGTTTSTFSMTQSGSTIGSAYPGSGPLNGYISDLRIIKGTALYTSNFVPQFTSSLSNVTNTQLLTLQTNGSHNNSTFKDSSSFNNIITRNGNTTNGTFSPYGDNFSVYFGTTAMGVQTPANSHSTVTGYSYFQSNMSMTIEAWIFPLSRHSGGGAQLGYLIGDMTLAGGTYYWGFGPDSNGKLTLGWYTGSVVVCNSTNAVPLNTWTHVAVSINAGTIKLFINGTLETLVGTTSTSNVSGNGSTGYVASGGYTSAGTTWQGFNGYISNLRVVKSALYSTSFNPSTTPLTTVASTSLLLFNSNRFTDSSVNSYALTVTSTPTVQKFSPFSTVTVPKYYSSYFDGATDYLKLPISTSGQLGSGNFTVECWVYLISKATSYPTIFCNYTTYTSGSFAICYAHTSGNTSKYSVIVDGNFPAIYSTGSITYRQWTHLAVARSGSTVTFYIDGVVQGTYSSSATLNGNGSYTYIGSVGDDLTNGCIQGYVSNLRVVVGTAIYTSAFTPSTTPLTAVSGTTILTCQNNTFVDNSTNANVITANGDVKPLLVSPFTPTISTTNLTYNPTTFGGSMYFDGTGDYLTVADSTSFDFPGNFTMEAWVYPTALSGNNNIISQWTSGLNFIFKVVSSGRPYFAAYPGGTVVTQGTTTAVLAYQWNHVAVTRSGTTIRLFVNGIQDATTGTVSGTIAESAPVYVGSLGTSEYWSGYITDLKVINGTALYVNSFSPRLSPSTPTTTVGSTIYSSNLLLSGASGGVIDATRTVDLETVADAKVTNFSPYNGSYYSNYFDGTGDYLTLPSNQTQFTMGTGDFTIEMWINVASYAAGRTLYDTMNGGDTGGTGRFAMQLSTSGVVQLFTGAGSIFTSGGTVAAGTWTHIAYVRISNSGKLYVNGTQVNTTYTDNNNYVVGTTSRPIIGINAYDSSTNPMFGYISNLRVVKGSGLYTGAFTPSTTPLTAVSGTSLLTCQSNKFVDNSTNNFTITRNGDTKVVTQNPFQVNTGQSYYFDGTGDYLASPNSPNLNFGSGSWTIECWIYPTGNYTTYNTIFAKRNDTTLCAYEGYLAPTTGYLGYYNGTLYTSTTAPTTNAWNHVVYVYNGTAITIYLNGVSVLSTNTTNTDQAVPFYVGCYNRAGTIYDYYFGYISDLRITRGYARYTTTFTPPSTPYKTN